MKCWRWTCFHSTPLLLISREHRNGSPALAVAASEAAREPMDADLVLNSLAASPEPQGELLVNPSSDSLGDSAYSLNKAAS